MPKNVCILDIPNSGSVSVVIERKKIASCRLKVFPSQIIKFSVPSETSSRWIVRYLQNKKNWIAEKLEIYDKTKGYEATEVINHGTSIRMLGEDMIFSIYKSEKNWFLPNTALFLSACQTHQPDRKLNFSLNHGGGSRPFRYTVKSLMPFIRLSKNTVLQNQNC